MSLGRPLKRLAESVLTGFGPSATARWLRREQIVVLAYHNVVPRGERPAGEASLHVGQRAFGQQLDRLSETHDIVALDDLWEKRQGGARPRAVITFDDAYGGAVHAGVEELVARNLPGTIFVVPGMLGGRSFWWDRLADPDSGTMSPELRLEALEVLGGRDEAVSEWARRDGLPEQDLPDHARTATRTELDHAFEYPGIALGSHTWSHANLAFLASGDARDEMARAANWLGVQFGLEAPWISYPYGLANNAVRRSAVEWYAGGLDIAGGFVNPASSGDHFAIPRVNVPAGVSLAGFELRACGLGRL